MKIVIIDDLNLEQDQIKVLRRLSHFKIYNDKPTENQIIKRISNANIVVTNTTKITKKTIYSAPHLIMIAAAATGAELIVDLKAAAQKNITVTNVPGYATESVAELTFGLIFNLSRKILSADKSIRQGNNNYKPFLGQELKGKTLGIIGLGKIGKKVSQLALAFEMKVIANDIKPQKEIEIKMVNLKSLLKKSDIVTIHCDLNPRSKKLLGIKELSLMKTSALLINTAREEIIDEKALLIVLEQKKIAGLGLEFNILRNNLQTHPFLQLENTVLTPHIGFFTKEALSLRKQIVFENIINFLKGNPQNIFKL